MGLARRSATTQAVRAVAAVLTARPFAEAVVVVVAAPVHSEPVQPEALAETVTTLVLVVRALLVPTPEPTAAQAVVAEELAVLALPEALVRLVETGALASSSFAG